MVSLDIAGASGAASLASGLEIGKGAIAGALVVSAAYLAGYAVLRRGSAAFFALLMVLAAAGLQIGWLGFAENLSPRVMVLLEGVFGAAAVIYLSAVARVVRRNAVIGGLMLAAALTLLGVGVINLTGRGDATGLMQMGLGGVAGVAILLALTQWNRDPTARLLLPGAILAGLAPFSSNFAGSLGDGFTLLAPTLFAIGVIAASLVALTEDNIQRAPELGLREHGSHHSAEAAAMFHADARECEAGEDEHMRMSETQLAKVADYAGVAVWDWCPHGAHQTDGMPTLMGADSRSPFTPEAIRAFIHKDDLGKLESKILASGLGDGSFDQVLKLHDGRHLRFRGARAVDDRGDLERIVAFVESIPDPAKAARAASAATAAFTANPKPGAPLQHNAAPAAGGLAGAFADALSKGDISAVFQPIVSLDDHRVAGFETLARWTGRPGEPDRASAEDLVRAAESSGKGGALARVMLEEAAQFLAREIKTSGRRSIFVAMNLSYAQMREPGFPASVKRVMSQYNLPPKSLVLELTESQAISEKDAGDTFKALREAGAALAFDDFGSGFSSLSNLRKYSFDYLKIDKSFVDGLVKGNESGKIAQAIASLGRDLGLTVIAEGIETRETADAARKIGCTLGQGYALGAPGKASEPRDLELSAAGPREARPARSSMWRRDLR